MRRKVKAVKPRFWVFMLTVFALTLTGVCISQGGFMSRQAQVIAELEVQQSQIAAQNLELQRKIDFTYTDEYIIREARDKLGLLMPDEILFESND